MSFCWYHTDWTLNVVVQDFRINLECKTNARANKMWNYFVLASCLYIAFMLRKSTYHGIKQKKLRTSEKLWGKSAARSIYIWCNEKPTECMREQVQQAFQIRCSDEFGWNAISVICVILPPYKTLLNTNRVYSQFLQFHLLHHLLARLLFCLPLLPLALSLSRHLCNALHTAFCQLQCVSVI